MQFNDTTNKNGIIQTIERWAGLPDGTISGNSTALKEITSSINDAFDTILPIVLSATDFLRWDDINHSDQPVGTFDIVSGQPDYTITADDNSLDILNIVEIKILKSSSATEYETLERLTADDPLAGNAVSPNPSETGVPHSYLERGNTIFLYPKPNYAATAGAKIFFEREPSYFASTDTTKEPGIPKPFHVLLALYAALDYISIYKSDNTRLQDMLLGRIQRKERELSDMIDRRNPTTKRIIVRQGSNR